MQDWTVTNIITEKQKKTKFQNYTNALIKNYFINPRMSNFLREIFLAIFSLYFQNLWTGQQNYVKK